MEVIIAGIVSGTPYPTPRNADSPDSVVDIRPHTHYLPDPCSGD